jgi:hypothetical protein
MNTMSAENPSFPVRDLNLAAHLFADGVPLLDVVVIGPSKVEYHFAEPLRCERLAKDFCSGAAMINSRLFVEGIKRARDLRDTICLSASRAR